MFILSFSFNPLWKMLIDRGMTREELRVALSLSPSTMAKMSKGENINLEILHRICTYFDCQPGDLIEYIPSKQDTKL